MNSDHSTAGPRPKQGLSRREEYAQVTRQAIVDAARRLFSEQGYSECCPFFSFSLDAKAGEPVFTFGISASAETRGFLKDIFEIKE